MSKATPTKPPHPRLLSVIIPAYNAADTLGKQLEALNAQEYDGDWEVVVVDNCSTDNTVNLVRDYQRLMPNLRLVYAPAKRNRPYARNIGAQAARGDAFIFCDADDITAPGWLDALAEALEKHDLVAGVIEVHALNQSAVWRPAPLCGTAHPIFDFLPYVIGCNMAVSREAFEAVGGFSEDFFSSHDVDISWRLQLHGYTVKDAPAAVIHYRYRKTWWAMWKQTVAISESQVLLYKRFAAYGMSRPSLREAWQTYKYLIKQAPRLWHMEHKARARWVRWLAISWGRLRGSLRYRTFFL